MLDHWTLLRKARKALRDGCFEEAYELTLDPLIRDHVRARDLRSRALKKLMNRARSHRDRRNLSAAYHDVRRVLSAGEQSAEVVEMERELREALRNRDDVRSREDEILREAERDLDAGRLLEARARLQAEKIAGGKLAALLERVETRIREVRSLLEEARERLEAGRPLEARQAVSRASAIQPGHPELEVLGKACERARAERVLSEIRGSVEKGDVRAAWELARRGVDEEPAIAGDPLVERVAEARAGEALEEARRSLRDGAPHEVALRLADARSTGVSLAEAAEIAQTARFWQTGLEHVDAGELEAGEALLSLAQDRSPESTAIRRSVEDARAARARVESEVASGVEHLRTGDLSRARHTVESAARISPNQRFLRCFVRGIQAGSDGRIVPPEEVERAIREGRLEEACELCAALFCTASLRDEATRLLLRIDENRRGGVREYVEAQRANHRYDSSRDQLEESLRRVEASLNLDRDSAPASSLKGDIEKELTIRDRIEWGEAHERRGEWADALKWFREGLEIMPGHPLCESRIRIAEERLGREELTSLEEDFRTGRWAPAKDRVESLLRHAWIPAQVRKRAMEIAGRLGSAAEEAVDLECRARELFDEGMTDEVRIELDRLFAVFPGHPGGRELRSQLERFDAARPEIDAIERDLDVPGGGDPGDLLERIERLPSDLPAVRKLLEKVKQRSTFSSRFVIRVEEGSDYLVLPGDRIAIGNILGKSLDLSIMASISSRHAEIHRSRSFHGGMRYELHACTGKDCFVNGEPVTRCGLKSGDRIRLGDDLEIEFHLPSSRSKTALLRLGEGFETDGINKILLMVPAGKDGRIVLSPGSGGHVAADRAEKEIEIYRAAQGPNQGEMVCRSPTGVRVDEQGGRAEERIYPGCQIQCGPCRLTVESVS